MCLDPDVGQNLTTTYFNENFISDDNLKWAWRVCSNIPIALIVVTLDYRTKFEKVSFNAFIFGVTFNVFVFGGLSCLDGWIMVLDI